MDMTSEGLGEMFEGDFAEKMFTCVDGETSRPIRRAQIENEDPHHQTQQNTGTTPFPHKICQNKSKIYLPIENLIIFCTAMLKSGSSN